MKYNFIYLTEDLLKNKFYIGKHSTNNLDDGYIGSGTIIKHIIAKQKKEGKDYQQRFKRTILQFCQNEEECYRKEKYWTDLYNAKNNSKFYNLIDGGQGNPGHEQMKKNHADVNGEKNPMYGKHHTEATKEKIRKKRIGTHHTDQTRKKISDSHKTGQPGSRAKKVKCLNTGVVFLSCVSAAKWCNLKHSPNIGEVCNGKRKTAGKHPETKQPLKWEWY